MLQSEPMQRSKEELDRDYALQKEAEAYCAKHGHDQCNRGAWIDPCTRCGYQSDEDLRKAIEWSYI